MITNNTYLMIIVYAIVIILISAIKPDFLYDSERKQYREFGRGQGKTLFTFPIVAVIIAIIFALILFAANSADQVYETNQINRNKSKSGNVGKKSSKLTFNKGTIPIIIQNPTFSQLGYFVPVNNVDNVIHSESEISDS